MKQTTFASAAFDSKGKVTRREKFLNEVDAVVPWEKLYRLIKPVYPKAQAGRPPHSLKRLLRIHFLQHFFNLSDPGVEEALYEHEQSCRGRTALC